MNLREIELFGTLMRVGTTTETARVLGISQPGVSAQLKRLETHIGFSLFHRVGNRLEPTAEGHQLFADAGPIFKTHTDVRGRITELSVQADKPVAVSATPAVIEGYLGNVLRQSAYMNWRKRLHVRVTEPEADLRERWADLGLQMAVPPRAEFHSVELDRIPMYAVLQKGNSLAARSELSLADFGSQPLVCYNSGSSPMGAVIRDAYEAKGLKYDPSCVVPFSATVCHFVESCGGIGIVDGLTVGRPMSSELVARRLVDVPSVALMAFYRRNEPLRAAVHDLLHILTSR